MSALVRFCNFLCVELNCPHGHHWVNATPEGIEVSPQDPPFEAPPATGDLRGDLVNMVLLALGLVLTLWVAFRIITWLTAKKEASTNLTSPIRLIATRSLGPRARLHLIEIPGKRVLVAQSPTELRALTESPAPSEEKPFPWPDRRE